MSLRKSTRESIEDLKKKKEKVPLGGGRKRIDKQHEAGKLTARERIDLLLDKGSFQELGVFVTHRTHDFGLDKNKPVGDGVVAGHGTVNGRRVFIFAQDFTVFGGTMGEMNARKIC